MEGINSVDLKLSDPLLHGLAFASSCRDLLNGRYSKLDGEKLHQFINVLVNVLVIPSMLCLQLLLNVGHLLYVIKLLYYILIRI